MTTVKLATLKTTSLLSSLRLSLAYLYLLPTFLSYLFPILSISHSVSIPPSILALISVKSRHLPQFNVFISIGLNARARTACYA